MAAYPIDYTILAEVAVQTATWLGWALGVLVALLLVALPGLILWWVLERCAPPTPSFLAELLKKELLRKLKEEGKKDSHSRDE